MAGKHEVTAIVYLALFCQVFHLQNMTNFTNCCNCLVIKETISGMLKEGSGGGVQEKGGGGQGCALIYM